MGLRKPISAPISTEVPAMSNVQKLPGLATAEQKGGTGVHDSYKKAAHEGANVMWRAKVKGRKTLVDDIPLHASLKTFNDQNDVPIDEIKQKAQELGLQRPDSSKLKYEATTHVSPRTNQTYYMLKLHGTDPAYQKFNDHFKGRGITYPSFMGHITIDKELHDQIQREGIQPHEVEFSPLMIEHGANNPTHLIPDVHSHKDATSDITPKKLNPVPEKHEKLAASECIYINLQKAGLEHFESLNKSTLKRIGTAATIIGGLSGSPHVAAAPNTPAQANSYSTGRMLNAISQVESSGGKNVNHAAIPGKMHHNEHAIGSYGLTPVVIRETVKMNPDLKRYYPKAASLQGKDLQHYFQDNPGLEHKVAESHLRRLEHHFGGDPAKLAVSWLDGITGTKQKLKQGMDPSKHWHAIKVLQAYGKGK